MNESLGLGRHARTLNSENFPSSNCLKLKTGISVGPDPDNLEDTSGWSSITKMRRFWEGQKEKRTRVSFDGRKPCLDL